MEIFNTLTRNKTEISPIDKNTVRIYSCGPTVYDHAHIGNLAAYIFADTLRRAISNKFETLHVMNYTDVDDKTIKRSHEKYRDIDPKDALKRLTDTYIDQFRSDMKKIGNDIDALHFIRATDTIEGMKQLISDLYHAGFAYLADDGLYFSIEAYKKAGKKYGQLTKINAQNTSSSRIQNDEYDKESVHDFALWKKQKDDEPAWDFVLNDQDLRGRPGWHIECSVMSAQELGQPFDIHTGGIDLIFPHHENEIAQSTALTNNPIMATIFTHNNHVLVDGKKMAKSANNFYTLDDIENKGYEPLAFRLMILQSHYRNEAHFSWDNLKAAQNRLKNYRIMADRAWQQVASNTAVAIKELKDSQKEITKALYDDLNTPKALELLSHIEDKIITKGVAEPSTDYYKKYLSWIDQILGLKLSNRLDINDEQKSLLLKREEARNNHNWQLSDKIRDILADQKIDIKDTPSGQIWSRI